MISARSSLSTSFKVSTCLYQAHELKMDVMLSFFSLIFLIVVLESSSKFLSFCVFIKTTETTV